MTTQYDDNISTIDNLTNLLSSSTLSGSSRASISMERDELIKKFVKERHKNKKGEPYEISIYYKNGVEYFNTRVSSNKKISAHYIDELYKKLYEYYSGKDTQKKLSIQTIFGPALEWHAKKSGNTLKTIKRSQYSYSSYIKETDFAKKPLKDIKAIDIENFLIGFKDKITRKRLCDIKGILNWIFEYAVLQEYIPYNIAFSIRVGAIKTVPEKSVGEMSYTDIEVEKLLRHMWNSSSPYEEALCFNCYVGLRYSELADLTWDDFDQAHNVLIVRHAYTESGNIKNGDKGTKTIPLCRDALSILKKCLEERPDSKYIFPNNNGNRISNNHLNEHLKKACEELGIKYRSNHKLRAHFITSIAYYSDANRARIMGGQSDIRTTQRYLNKSITPKDYETVEKAFDYGLSTNFDQDLGKEKTS